jgi:hypothetical protein
MPQKSISVHLSQGRHNDSRRESSKAKYSVSQTPIFQMVPVGFVDNISTCDFWCVFVDFAQSDEAARRYS